MGITLHTGAARDDLDRKIGGLLLRMAVTVQTGMMRRMNTSNQRGANPSPSGGWLHKGTGNAQAGCVYSPTTPAAVAQAGSVRIGFTPNAFYAAYWGLPDTPRRRKSLVDCVEELRPQLAALAGK
jgi:hypothetical protein